MGWRDFEELGSGLGWTREEEIGVEAEVEETGTAEGETDSGIEKTAERGGIADWW